MLFYSGDETLDANMGTIEKLSTEHREQVAAILEEAAGDIVQFGWRKGDGYPFETNGDYPRCVWIASQRAMTRERRKLDELFTEWSDRQHAADDAIVLAAEVNDIEELLTLNDSQSDEEGQAWAYGVLISAARILNPALVHGDRKTVSFSTDETDTGSTRNVISRLLSFMKRFTWVR